MLVEVVVPIAVNVSAEVLYNGVILFVKQLWAKKQNVQEVSDEPLVEIESRPDGNVKVTIRNGGNAR